MTDVVAPQLSYWLPSWSAKDPGGWRHLRDAARIADETGIDRVVVSDHVVFGENLDAYGDPALGGSAGGRQPTGPDGHWLDPLTVLTYVAGFTDTVRLGTAILIAALRRPVVLAKELATLDVLSGGRVDLGVGVGWQREEYQAAGLDFEGRGRLLDHTLEVCQTLWRQQRASFADDLLRFDATHQMPKPLQPGGVPIWVSGTFNRNVVRRLAAYGSGWIPWGPAAEDLPSSIPRMKQAMTDAGRTDAGALQVVGFLPMAYEGRTVNLEATIAATKPLLDAGVTDFRVSLRFTGDFDTDKGTVFDIVDAFSKAFR
ncbi:MULTISPECIES: TIGR03619 family F420-dependent LLM class oxidoreductase [unclassified Mycobacterium]|uniref:TIGR03619 family F420-dependent LLM class oxidoreductase n=1 Tax=unclassified Mycobacterium TaxID=2642494 RepID=UPI0029C6E35F|nr:MULTISPECIES: TIGR03619 family F420-dependent LLM class oxidoreductase [unclassified Mycobacterium]